MIPTLVILQAVSPAADPAYAAAVEARLAGRTADAIAAFEQLSRVRPSDADIWLNLGLSYSAAGRYAEAEGALETALRLAPEYSDAQLAWARAALYRGDRVAAAQRLAPLEAARPDDPEVRRVAAQIKSAPDQARRWRLDVSHAESRLTHGLGEWRATSLALGRSGRGWSASGLIEQTERFGREDVFLEATLVRRLGRGDAFLALGGAVDPDYRPEGSLRAGLSTVVGPEGPWRVRLGADAVFARYSSGDVRSVQPHLAIGLGRGEIALRSINTVDERDEFRAGYSLRGTWAAGQRLLLFAGWADAPESSEGVTVEVEALNAGAAMEIGEATQLRLDYTHETRPAYERDELALSVTRRF
jgi:YaiO family outer membrane protein